VEGNRKREGEKRRGKRREMKEFWKEGHEREVKNIPGVYAP